MARAIADPLTDLSGWTEAAVRSAFGAVATLRCVGRAGCRRQDPGLTALGEIALARGQAAARRGESSLAGQHFAAAEKTLLRAQRILEDNGARSGIVLGWVLDRLAEVDMARGARDAARVKTARALDLVQERLGLASAHTPSVALAEQERAARVARGAMDRLWAEHGADTTRDPAMLEQLVRAAQLGAASRTGFAMQAHIVAGAQTKPVADMISERGRILEQWRAAEGQIAVAAAVGQARKKFLGARRDIGARIARIEAQLAASAPEILAQLAPTPVGVAALQAQLGPNEALVIYAQSARLSALVIRRDGASGYRLSPAPEHFPTVDAAIDALLMTMDPRHWEWRVAAKGAEMVTPAFETRSAQALYAHLVAPFEADIAATRTLRIVLDPALARLPLQALLKAPPVVGRDGHLELRTAAWFGQSHAISVAPSAPAFLGARRTAPLRARSTGFLGIGDPLLAQAENASGAGRIGPPEGVSTWAEPSELHAMGPLKHAGLELEALKSLMNAAPEDLLVQARAVEPLVRQRLQKQAYAVIAFATHATAADAMARVSEPGLVLTPPARAASDDDGLLTLSEVAALPIDADWVLLSACRTASPDGSAKAEMFSGLARAFLVAGAQSVLASYWDVNDEAARLFTTEMIRVHRTGADKAQAAQQAAKALIDKGFAHPAYWAAFALLTST